MKKARRSILLILALALVFGVVFTGLSAFAAESMDFEVVTEVFEYGQDSTAVIIDAGAPVNGSTINKDTFSVYANNTLDGGSIFAGAREVTKAYVNDVKEADGVGKASGRYIVLELKHGFTVAGATTLTYNATVNGTRYGNNHRLDLNFEVTQNAAYSLSAGSVVSQADYTKVGDINLKVDDFDLETYDGMNYRIYKPESSKALPLVLWNHGAGENNNITGNSNNEGMQLMANMGGVAWIQNEYPCYVLAPQRSGSTGYSISKVIAVINNLIAEGKVDAGRVYVAGCSAGGNETLSYLAQYPSLFAASVPICPAGTTNYTNLSKHTEVPMWFFHSADDASVNVSRTREKIDYLNTQNPKELKYTEVENLPYSEHGVSGLYQGHWSWILPLNNYYSDEYQTNVFDWLFSKHIGLDFDVVTEVFEYGQDSVAVIIDAGEAVDGSSVNKDTFSVYANNTLDGGTVFAGAREVTNAYVNDVKEADGVGKAIGRYIVLELKHGFTVAGATTLTYNTTVNGIRYGSNHRLDLNFEVTQNAAYQAAGESVTAKGLYKAGDINLKVDEFELETYSGMNYRIYKTESSKALPLVLWNHGAGENNNITGNSNNEGMQLMANMGGVAWIQDEYPCYVLAPQRSGSTGYSTAKVIAVIKQLIADGKVDANRVYVGGCSAGGNETLTYLKDYSNLFAAAVPICPAGTTNYTNLSSHTEIPMWFFHSADDASVNVSRTREKIAFLNTLNPKELKYTEVENLPYSEHGVSGLYQGHWSWILPLNNYYSNEYQTNVFDWLFSKTRATVKLSAQAGDTVTVPITVNNASFFAGVQGVLEYDETVLTLESISAASGFIVTSKGNSFLSITTDGMNVSGTQVIGYAVFTVKQGLDEDLTTYVNVPKTSMSVQNENKENAPLTIMSAEVLALAGTPMRGDVNLDGKVDLADAILLLQYISKNAALTGKQLRAADATGDGAVNTADVIVIMQMCLA